MKRSKKLIGLLLVLAVVCLATVALSQWQQHQDKIQNSEEVILALKAEEVKALSWKEGSTSFAFSKDESGVWRRDSDADFPVNQEKIASLLTVFEEFTAAFIIESAENLSDYGLDDAEATIYLSTDSQNYQVDLGDFSTLDEQRYVSIGDGNAYLVTTDPLDSFSLTESDLLAHDAALIYTELMGMTFSGAENYTITYVEDSPYTYCADDVYFTQRGGERVPLDTDILTGYITDLRLVGLRNYVTYKADDDEIAHYGLDDPELTITVNYTVTEEGEAVEKSYTLHLSRSAEDKVKGAAEEGDTYSAYARVGESAILYEIGSDDFEMLMACSYNDLRHTGLFTGAFEDVTAIDVTLDGTDHSLTVQPSAEDKEVMAVIYGEAEMDSDALQTALGALSVTEFSDVSPAGKEEVSLTLHLDNENFPEVTVVLYRYDGTSCTATVDGEPIGLVARTGVVDLIEAINAIVLN